MINIESEDDDFISDSEDVITPGICSKQIALELDQELGKTKRRRVYWEFDSVFEDYQETQNAIKKKWIRIKHYNTKKGFKEYFKCAINEKYKAQMHLHVLNDSQHVNMFRDTEEHKHDIIVNSNKRLRKEIKKKFSNFMN